MDLKDCIHVSLFASMMSNGWNVLVGSIERPSRRSAWQVSSHAAGGRPGRVHPFDHDTSFVCTCLHVSSTVLLGVGGGERVRKRAAEAKGSAHDRSRPVAPSPPLARWGQANADHRPPIQQRFPFVTQAHHFASLIFPNPSTPPSLLPHTPQSRLIDLAVNIAAMLHTTAARRAVQTLPAARRFSSTPTCAAVSPYRKSAPSHSQSPSKRNVSDTAKRPAQAATATSTQRPMPSPSFQRDEARLRDIQPLQPFRQPEMDHSLVGMTGGQIFHEMMLRQGVKKICTWSVATLKPCALLTPHPSRIPRWRYPPRLRCHLQQPPLRLHPPAARTRRRPHG